MAASAKLAHRVRRRGAHLKLCSRRPGGKGSLKRLKLAVEGFVQATSEGQPPGGFEGRGAAVRSRPLGKKSRKELRREKRQLRKARRLQRARGTGADQRGGQRQPSCQGPRGRGRPAEARPGKTEPSVTSFARKRALLAANEEEDREIRKLERCLGLNKRKKKGNGSSVPLSFTRDGLDYILGVLEPGTGGSGLYVSSGEEYEEGEESGEAEIPPDSDGDSECEENSKGKAHPTEDEVENVEEDSDEGVDPELSEEVEGRARKRTGRKRVRFAEDEDLKHKSLEDEDASHQESLCESSEKDVQPQVRCAQETVNVHKKAELERLKKQVKGLINRLSEPNMAFISGQLEELYMAHSRKDMSDTLTATLMDACVTSSAMPSRLMMEHILLVSILHQTVGIEVGACFLEAVVRRFDDAYHRGGEGKESDNLITIVAHLYNFHVVQSLLIFDVLKKLIGTFTEKDIELILLMLKNVGFSLRKDDASSLKELITEAQAKASTAGSMFQDRTRIRFMLEIMLALKNNDMRKIPGYDPEPVERLRKLQRALVRNASSGSETQLRISWEGILNAEQTGRWWIMGSAWSGVPMIDNSHHAAPQRPLAGTVSAKILELARKQRMNTDVRRNIFCTVMTSEDFLDAFEKLLKLGLKDQQEREIIHVLMDCCLQEKTYNPFYAFLASKFCGYERRFQVVEFSELDKPRVHFLRKVLTMLLMETEVEDLSLIFSRVSDNPKLSVLREGLKLFISHFLLRHVQAQRSPEEANVLRERAGLASKALQGRAALRM
ncbi:Nucleolar MIF4G domain-containing protein 1 [Fukomys damarensis]|uniref:Nucleolar MIF4G domain-containing protein 1 n=1 Tax=Fukomys damarensis TaxID=885580 RepID=A0A091E1V2_FUKDA|nr:Nucleolar MIF4G domain-containing protein 1 [Fukomys damarensis]